MAAPAVNGSLFKGGISTSGTSVTVSTTVNSSLSNSVLIAIVGTNANAATTDVTGITYNSVALTKRIFHNNSTTPLCSFWVWTLDNPSAGTFNTVLSAGVSRLYDMYVFTITGAKQGGAIDQDVVSSVASASTSASNSITTSVNDTLIFDFFYTNGNPSNPVPGGSQTLWINDSPSASTDGAFGSYLAKATAGSQSISMSWTTGEGGIYGTFNFQSAPAAAALPYRALQGVGI